MRLWIAALTTMRIRSKVIARKNIVARRLPLTRPFLRSSKLFVRCR